MELGFMPGKTIEKFTFAQFVTPPPTWGLVVVLYVAWATKYFLARFSENHVNLLNTKRYVS
jgi:hypothetical protein